MNAETAVDVADMVDAAAPVLIDAAVALGAAGDVDGLAALLALVRRARTTLAFAESEIESVLARTMPSPVLVVAAVGVLERRGGRRRTNWDHPRLISLLAARAADRRVDRETGEVLPPAVFAQLVADELTACAGISYWRVGQLRERGVDPASYCDEGPARATVTIRETPS